MDKDLLINELERCKVWIENALLYSGGTHDFVDVVDAVLEGRMQLWPAEDACMVTEISVYPKKKILHGFLAGGNMKRIEEMRGDAEEWAKLQGCSAVSIAGRAGWERVFKKYGWEFAHTVLVKEL